MTAKAEKKDRSREKILESAGSLMREKGITGTSVADVMGGAGMTVGGFYAHFPSKQELVAETLRSSLRKSRCLLDSYAGEKSGAEWVEAVVNSYLSRSHRDNPKTGCPLPATTGELAAADIAVREVLAEEIDIDVSDMAERLKDAGVDKPRGEALAALSIMVGGLTLARALKGTPLSDEVLKACRDHVKRSMPE
ncbi:MAG: TetR/AcrR family transcriptional regulator [Candidatus Geothermincolia bacterium]